MASIEGEGHDDVRRALENLVVAIDAMHVSLRLSRRSQLIVAVHGVAESFFDLADDVREDVVAAFSDYLEKLDSIKSLTDPQAARVAIGRALGSALRKLTVMTIDERDLIDTGQFRSDVSHAPTVLGE